jgi:uncharacterized membrane protein
MDSKTEDTPRYSETVGDIACNGSGKKRIAMFLAGSSALAYGLSRAGWVPRLLAAGGGFLVYRSLAAQEPTRSYFLVSQTINKPVEEVYTFFHDQKNWPRLERNLPVGMEEYGQSDASDEKSRPMEIIDEVPSRTLRWRYQGAETEYETSAQFAAAPGNRGTEVWIFAECTAPTSPVEKVMKKAAGTSMEQNAREHLRHCKQLLEAGEIPTTVGQPVGSRGLTGKVKRAMFRETVAEGKRPSARAEHAPGEQIAVS